MDGESNLAANVSGATVTDNAADVYYNISKGILENAASKALKGTAAKGNGDITVGGMEYKTETDYTNHSIKIKIDFKNNSVTVSDGGVVS